MYTIWHKLNSIPLLYVTTIYSCSALYFFIILAEIVNDEFLEIARQKAPDTIAYYKKKLEEARKREGI